MFLVRIFACETWDIFRILKLRETLKISLNGAKFFEFFCFEKRRKPMQKCGHSSTS